MELSVIITSYKQPELLKLCLNSVKKNLAGSVESEIIVCEGESGEISQTMMREDYPEVKFFPFKKNVGLQALISKGIEKSQGDYLFIMNGDIIADEGSIIKLLEYIKFHPEIGMVGPKQINFNESLQYSCYRFYRPVTILYRRTFLKKFKFARKHLDWFLMKDYDHKNTKEVDWLMGSALMISRKALDRVGMMDPIFFMYMEDVDWCRRFWENEYKVVYYPDAQIHHYHGHQSRSGRLEGIVNLFFNKYTWIHISSAVKYFIKYWGKPLPKHK